jgi:hypothetical protein
MRPRWLLVLLALAVVVSAVAANIISSWPRKYA